MRHVWIVSYHDDQDGNVETEFFGTERRARKAIKDEGYRGGPTMFEPTDEMIDKGETLTGEGTYDRVHIERRSLR